MTGTILGIEKEANKVLIQPTESKPNRNIMVFGGPGSYKTQSVVITNVLNETEHSQVITDPKGEVYELTGGVKEMQGYEVHVLNFMDMTNSDRHNPIDYVNKDIEASTVATKIVDSANKDGKRDVWYYSQRALLKALILYSRYEFEPKDRTMTGILDFLQEFDPANNEKGDSELDKQFMQLDRRHPARRSYELGFKKSQGEMQGSIIMSLLTTISDFVDEEVSQFTSFSDFHLQDIGRKKIALYVIIPVMDNSWESLINIFFSQLFNELYKLGAKHGAKLPINVDFWLDEFVNLGKFPTFEEFLATCRGYGIGVGIILQSLTQLYDKYKREKAESILGNCSVKICLNSANMTTAEYFEKMLGKTTVRIDTQSKSKQHNSKDSGGTSTSEGEQYSQRQLMTADEIMTLPEDESVIVFSNKHPLRVKKAFQFKLFKGATQLNPKSQANYSPTPSVEQLERYKERITEYHAYRLKQQEETKQAEDTAFQAQEQADKKEASKANETITDEQKAYLKKREALLANMQEQEQEKAPELPKESPLEVAEEDTTKEPEIAEQSDLMFENETENRSYSDYYATEDSPTAINFESEDE